jgi:protein-S-isoprenylcysteine O-methyltransferase Ste14
MSVPHWVYRYRGIIVSPPLIAALVCFRGETEIHSILWSLGTLVFFLGVFLRIWAQQHLHYRLKGPIQLTVTGPYALVRNPIYIGNTFLCLGATFLSEVLWLVPLTLFWCATAYSLLVRYEEKHLLGRYGESYRKYRLEIPRWLPLVRFRNLGLRNEYFYASLVAEIHCPLLLLPYILKEALSSGYIHVSFLI